MEDRLFYLFLAGVCLASLVWQSLFLPLCFCLFFALCLKGPAQKLSRLTRLPFSLCAFLLVNLCFLCLAGALFLLCYSLAGFLPGLLEGVTGLLQRPEVAQLLAGLQNGLPDTLKNDLTGLISSAALGVGRWLSGFGGTLLSVMLVSLGTFLFTVNYDSGVRGLFRLLSPGLRKQFLFVKRVLLRGVLATVRMHAVMFLLFAGCIFVVLAAFGVKGALSLGLLISLFDLLPFVGVGGVLVPWGVYEICCGRPFFGAALCLVTAILSIVKGILEPKLLGSGMRVNPILTFCSMFVGLSAFGFMGAVLLPIYVSAGVELLKENRLRPLTTGASGGYTENDGLERGKPHGKHTGLS